MGENDITIRFPSPGPLRREDLMDRHALAYREWLLDQELLRSEGAISQRAFIQLRQLVGAA